MEKDLRLFTSQLRIQRCHILFDLFRRPMGSSKWYFMDKAVPDLPDDIIPFSVADMELKNAPEIMEGLQEFLRDDNIILGYTIPTPAFFMAVKSWLKRRHDWDVRPDWAALSPGVIPALYSAVRCFSEPGNGVIIFSPVYYPFRNAITVSKRTVVDIPLTDREHHYEIDWTAFEEAAEKPENKLLIFCSPHNPVGRVWTRAELEKLSDICLRNHVLVISDEIHEDLLMPGYRHIPYASLSEAAAQNSVTCIAPSKTFNLAGLQTALAFIPNPGLHKKFTEEMDSIYLRTLNTIGFKACEIAYTKCDGWYEALLEHINHNRQISEQFMAEKMPEIVVYPMEGTYLQWWDCRGLNMDYTELEHFMKFKAHFISDEGYILGESGKGFERINLACPTSALTDALNRMDKAYHS